MTWLVERYDARWGGWRPVPGTGSDDPIEFDTDEVAWSSMTYLKEQVDPTRQYRIRDKDTGQMDQVKARCRQEWVRGGFTVRCGKSLDGKAAPKIPGFPKASMPMTVESLGSDMVKCSCGFYNFVARWADGRVVVKASGEH